ncbi:MAG: NIPSNAP family protein [Chitinophagaceae bacterium]
MNKLFPFLLLVIAIFLICIPSKKSAAQSTSPETKLQPQPVYEMRVYYAHPGKLEDLHARFRNNTMRIFAKHGMTNIGYWVPMDNPENKLIYILSYPSREARNASFKAFGADPEWQAVAKASEVNGKIVAKVESTFMLVTDYSPSLKIVKSPQPRTFELRTYTASPGNLQNLHERFRSHTIKLFEKQGITNIIYFQPMDSTDGSKSNKLIYLISHKNKTTGDASWKAFREDPVWIAAKTASETKGGGSLTTKVESVFMMPTDYSQMK